MTVEQSNVCGDSLRFASWRDSPPLDHRALVRPDSLHNPSAPECTAGTGARPCGLRECRVRVISFIVLSTSERWHSCLTHDGLEGFDATPLRTACHRASCLETSVAGVICIAEIRCLANQRVPLASLGRPPDEQVSFLLLVIPQHMWLSVRSSCHCAASSCGPPCGGKGVLPRLSGSTELLSGSLNPPNISTPVSCSSRNCQSEQGKSSHVQMRPLVEAGLSQSSSTLHVAQNTLSGC